jgi:hypothetical protein
VHRPHLLAVPSEVLRLEVGVAQHARQAGGQQPPPSALRRLSDVPRHDALVAVIEALDYRPHPGTGMVPAHPGRVRQRRRDGHLSQFGHQPGEYLRVARGHVRRVPLQYLAAGPELLGVHGQRTDTDHRRERAGARKPAPGQPGLRRDTRRGPAVIGTRLHHHVRTASQPEAVHHRDLSHLEQHVGGSATQVVQTPGRQPVRQIAQRHSQDCATGTERTEARFASWTITGER